MRTSTPFMLFLSLLLFAFLGCQPNSKKDSKPTNGTTEDSSSKSDKDANQSIGEIAKSDTTEVVIAAVTPKVENTASKAAEVCGNPAFNLVENIKASAEKWKGTPYSRENGTDCSGMFHKVVDGIRDVCPNAALPTFAVDRSSRGIGVWYHDHGDFQFIRDPENSGHLINPGAVMLYGHGGKAYDLQNMTIDDLKKQGTGINHVAIVLSVEKEGDKVVSYNIFHGLNPGKAAAITTEVFKNPKYPNHPAYAHWNEPWLGVAPVLAAKKEPVQ